MDSDDPRDPAQQTGAPADDATAQQLGRAADPPELEQMLRAGAKHRDLPIKAAVHLLVFTDLLWQPWLVDQLNFRHVTGPDGSPEVAAFVRDWTTLLDGPNAHHLGGAATRLAVLAMGLATGRPIDLPEQLRSLGRVHAHRVVEAIAIATGHPGNSGPAPRPQVHPPWLDTHQPAGSP